MRFCWIIVLGAVAVVSAQVGSIGIKPGGPSIASSASPLESKRVPAAGAPLLGYQAGPAPTELHAIVGRIGNARLGEQIAVPDGTRTLYLPPRELYALVEKVSDEPLVVWTLHGSATSATREAQIPVAGVMAHPDLVAFSPRGTASALYSQASGTLQVVANLPAQPSVSKQLSLSSFGIPSHIAISDDSALIAAAFPDGRLMYSFNGASWKPFLIGFVPHVWVFVPKAHDLVISDTSQNTIVLLSNIEDAGTNSRVLAQNVQANHLAFTRNGEQLVATNSDAGQIWTVDVKAGTVTPREGTVHMETLSPLRDGFTFLLSSSPTVSVLRLNASPELPDAANLAQPNDVRR